MLPIDDLYKEVILEYSSNPVNKKLLPTNKDVKQAHQENQFCGDKLDLNITFKDGQVATVGWDGEGCVISQSSASVMSELIKGKSISELKEIFAQFEGMMNSSEFVPEVLGEAVSFKGVQKFPMRIKCALLSYMALKQIINEVEKGSK